MAELIGVSIVYGILYIIYRNKRKEQDRRNADEFMRKSFGEDYKEKMDKWSKGV